MGEFKLKLVSVGHLLLLGQEQARWGVLVLFFVFFCLFFVYFFAVVLLYLFLCC